MKKLGFLLLLPIVAGAVILFYALDVGQTQSPTRVNLRDKVQIPPVQQVNNAASSRTTEGALRVAVAGVLSPTRTLEYYRELLGYMEQKLGTRVTMVLKPTYSEINDLIRGQRVDMALVCSLPYVKGKESFNLELLVAPQMYGQTTYFSYLIVQQESKATGLGDLRGESFAFTDPLSNSGHLAPAYRLYLMGETPASFFKKQVFTYSHDNSITAVADRLLDGAAVDSLVYKQLEARNPGLISRTRIVEKWGPFGIPPAVVSPDLDPGMKQRLSDFFLNLDKSDEGKVLLGNLAIEKFVLIPDAAYDSIRQMKTAIGW